MAILLKQVKKSRAERETDEQGGQTARQMERRAGRETTRKFRLGGPKGGRGISGRFPCPSHAARRDCHNLSASFVPRSDGEGEHGISHGQDLVVISGFCWCGHGASSHSSD